MWTKNERERKMMVAVVIVTCVALLIWGMYLTGIIVRCPSVGEYEGKAPGILSDSAAQILFAEGMPEIGANAEGQAVFKNPHQALHYLKENYGEELALIEETMQGEPSYFRRPLFANYAYYAKYAAYAWMVEGGDKERMAVVEAFLDVYKNSYYRIFPCTGIKSKLIPLWQYDG